MHIRTKQLLLILILHVTYQANAQSTIPTKSVFRQGKDLHYYHHPEGETKSEYPVLTYSTDQYSREGLECSQNPFTSFIGRGLNFLLLKIGAVAIVKAILAALVLLKVPLFFLKMVFLKTFLFPVLITPLLLHFFTNQQKQEMASQPEDNKPPEMTTGLGRLLDDKLSTKMWRSLKLFAESEQCVERVACALGAYNKDSSDGMTFSRVLKLLEQSSTSYLQQRLTSIREAFKSGIRNGSCPEQAFICHGPELFIQQGKEKMQLL